MDFSVRRATRRDLEELVELTLREAKEAEGLRKSRPIVREGIRAALDDESVAVYWVLQDRSEKIAGSISVGKEWSNWNAGYYWWVQSLYIRSEHRGRGLMKVLIDAVRESARHDLALDLRLYVHKNNERALKAYRKAGFVDADYRILRIDV